MIGAMPAVAVRHERRKQEKKKSRPGQLYLANYATTKQTGSPPAGGCSHGGSPSPASQGTSPLANTPTNHHHLSTLQSPTSNGEEFYVCAKISILHVIVVSFLLGIILLIVGLVQLKPGADASDHRYYIIGAGSVLLLIGTLLTLFKCIMLPLQNLFHKRRLRIRKLRKEESTAVLAKAITTTDPQHPHPHHHHHHQSQHHVLRETIQELPTGETNNHSHSVSIEMTTTTTTHFCPANKDNHH